MTHQELEAFEQRYGYDAGYMHDLLRNAPDIFAMFVNVLPWAQPLGHLPIDVAFMAKIAAMQAEDCGPCLELTVKKAIEAGADRGRVQAALDGGGGLEGLCQDAYFLARAVAGNWMDDDAAQARERLRAEFGDAGIAELALSITAARTFPSMKRALGYHGKGCSLIRVEALA